MTQKTIIVGAGLIGAAIAFRLAQIGTSVCVIDAGVPGTAASGRSFGWINASFYHSETHHHFRNRSIEAFPRLLCDARSDAVNWQGCLWWEEQGDAFDAQFDDLNALNYPVRRLSRADVCDLAPALGNPPEHALLFPGEGVAEAGRLTSDLLNAACELGAQVISGVGVVDVDTKGGRVCGVTTQVGAIGADQVVVAAGVHTQSLLGRLDLELPMLTRPGLLLRTRPVPRVLNHIMVAPEQEFRQDPAGRIIAPTAAAHQADESEEISARPDTLADIAIRRLAGWLPGVELAWEQVSLAMRPVPGDGLPAIGPLGPEGLYVATMHSGVTLAAVTAELVTQELTGQGEAALLQPYRPTRFAKNPAAPD